MKKIIINGKIVTEDKVLEQHALVMEGDKILQIAPVDDVEMDGAWIYDGSGSYLIPGMIDIHSDMIEGLIQPRSTAIMDFKMSLAQSERILAMSGITTMYHSISMFREGTWDTKEIRQAPYVRKLAGLIADTKKKEGFIHHKYHLRYEIDNLNCYEQVKKMIEAGAVDLISFMDHSPGQGQYKNLSLYKKHLPNGGKDVSDEEFQQIIAQESNKAKASNVQLKDLARTALAKGISIASHDDDTIERLAFNEELGVSISEFPITLEVALEAVRRGFMTVLGAPNVMLGGSHSGNLSAVEAIQNHAASILVSDYYPQAMLHSVFQLVKENHLNLPQAVCMVTANPAKAAGLYETTGSLKAGKTADLLMVRLEQDLPFLEKVFVSGTCVVDCCKDASIGA